MIELPKTKESSVESTRFTSGKQPRETTTMRRWHGGSVLAAVALTRGGNVTIPVDGGPRPALALVDGDDVCAANQYCVASAASGSECTSILGLNFSGGDAAIVSIGIVSGTRTSWR